MIDEEAAGRVRNLGHDVVRVSDIGLAVAPDDAILARAHGENRVLVTLDEHFGDWSVLPLAEHPGVIRVKANPTTTDNILAVLLPLLERTRNRDYRNHLIIARSTGVRWVRTGVR
jgi:predicted nuclease of predicted toxin-antitoxin system